MTAKSVLMHSQGLLPKACAPTCPLLCYSTATLQIHPPTELKLANINDRRMGVSIGERSRAGFSYMILIKQMDEFVKNERTKSDEFALLVGDLVYTLFTFIILYFSAGYR